MNQGASPLMVFEKDCNQVVEEISRLLGRSGLTVVESFDLQVARAGHIGCTCPHHGTDQCACQLAILLIYGDDAMPVSLMVHGNEEGTEVSIIETAGLAISPAMKIKITETLQQANFNLPLQESMANVS
jgi:hypothetical protein